MQAARRIPLLLATPSRGSNWWLWLLNNGPKFTNSLRWA